jgi:hypothetical protein
MANSSIQVKRTSVSGRLPDPVNTSNSSYIAPGEFAINLADKKVYTSDGSAVFEVGANISSLNVQTIVANSSTGIAGYHLMSNGTGVYWSDDRGYTGSQGYTGSKGDIGYTGSQGVIGFTGSKGTDGTIGVDGYTGSRGFTGSRGTVTPSDSAPVSPISGEIWFDSTTGKSYFYYNDGTSSQWVLFADPTVTDGRDGYTGSKGDIGYTGSKGDTGFIGSRGYTGSQGVGFTGSQGATGFTGSFGITGFTGSQGVIGYTGSQGTTGFTGSQGNLGYTGSKGDTGQGFKIAKSYLSVAALTADTSPTGILAGEFAIIETGDVDNPENSRLYLWNGSVYSYTSDLSGAQGITGPQGNIGYTGSKGDTGFTGSQGVTGFVGSQGNLGYTGSKGDTGFTGSSGFTGSFGYTGSKGTTYIGSTAPGSPTNGDTWWNSENGIRYVYYADANSSQWVQESPIGPRGLTGYTGSGTDFTNVGSDIIPSTNSTYNIGSTTNQWKNLWVSNSATIAKIQEPFIGLTNANSVFVHDCSNTQIFNHTSLSSNFTANFTNLNLANNNATSITLILNQGVTAYVANSVQIGGVSQTVNWQGNTSPPTGTANKKDIMSFSILNASGTYTVFGQLTSFG